MKVDYFGSQNGQAKISSNMVNKEEDTKKKVEKGRNKCPNLEDDHIVITSVILVVQVGNYKLNHKIIM
jgi:hypothetical protein